MDNWQATFLGLKHLPRELTAFEMEAFFTFTSADRQMIEDRRRSALKPAASGAQNQRTRCQENGEDFCAFR